jgi:hypothetical protein
MHRIDKKNFSTDENLFTKGDVREGISPTVVSPEWLNDIQENICNTIQTSGIKLESGNYKQLSDSIEIIVSEKIKPLINDITNLERRLQGIEEHLNDRHFFKTSHFWGKEAKYFSGKFNKEIPFDFFHSHHTNSPRNDNYISINNDNRTVTIKKGIYRSIISLIGRVTDQLHPENNDIYVCNYYLKIKSGNCISRSGQREGDFKNKFLVSFADCGRPNNIIPSKFLKKPTTVDILEIKQDSTFELIMLNFFNPLKSRLRDADNYAMINVYLDLMFEKLNI